MADKEWLDDYEGDSIDELLALADTYRVDSIVVALETRLLQKVEAQDGEGMSEPEIVVLAVEDFEREVNNGGFHQFMHNSGNIVEPAWYGLEMIGCSATAALLAEAVSAIGFDLSKSVDSEEPIVTKEAIEASGALDDEAVNQALEALDERLFASYEPVADHLLAYVREHRADIHLG